MPDRPVPHYDSVEEEALAALADEDDADLCDECGGPGTEDGIHCFQCKIGLSNAAMLACPFCPTTSGSTCPHLVAVVEGEAGWVEVPVDEDELPCLDDDGASPDDWADGEVAAIFGELAPLAGTYESPGLTPHLGELYERLAGLMTTPVVPRTGINAMALYSDQRDGAVDEIRAIVGGLAAGFERLAVRRRASGGGDTDG